MSTTAMSAGDYRYTGICHCIGDGYGNPCANCPAVARPMQQCQPFPITFTPWSKEAELIDSWRIKPRRRR